MLAEVDGIATTPREWEAVVDLLVEADLPVAVYDLAVDVLHERVQWPRLPRSSVYPWRAAGYHDRRAIIDALHRRGYTGHVSRTTADLWTILSDLLRDGSGDDLAGS